MLQKKYIHIPIIDGWHEKMSIEKLIIVPGPSGNNTFVQELFVVTIKRENMKTYRGYQHCS